LSFIVAYKALAKLALALPGCGFDA